MLGMKHFIPGNTTPASSYPMVIQPEDYLWHLHSKGMAGWPVMRAPGAARQPRSRKPKQLAAETPLERPEARGAAELHSEVACCEVSAGSERSREDAKVDECCIAPDALTTMLPCWLEVTSFVSLNRFFRRRRTEKLMSLNAVYVDLDFRDTPTWRNKSADEVQAALECHCLALKLAEPSFIIQTGQGLAAVWLIKPMPAKALGRWTAAIKALINLFLGFGADRSCSDATRVFRIPRTINEKNGREVRVTGGSFERYSFDALEDQIYIASGRPTRRQLEEREKVGTERKKWTGSMPRGLTPAQRFEQVQHDLERIAEYYGGWMPEGTRNTWLHLFGVSLSHQLDVGDVKGFVEATAARVTPGLDESDVRAIAKQAKEKAQLPRTSNPRFDGRYHYAGHGIADRLGVTADMAGELGLRQIVPLAELKRRRADRERQRRAKAGALSRAEWLDQNNASRTKPWEQLGIGRTKYYRLKKAGLLEDFVAEQSGQVRARNRGVATAEAPTGGDETRSKQAEPDQQAQAAQEPKNGPTGERHPRLCSRRTSSRREVHRQQRPGCSPKNEDEKRKRRGRTCGQAIPPGASPKGVLPCSTVTTPLSPRSRPSFTTARTHCRTQPCFWAANPRSGRLKGFSKRSALLRRSHGAYSAILESCMRFSRWSMCMTPTVRKQATSRRSTRHGRASRISVCSRTNWLRCSMRSYRPKH